MFQTTNQNIIDHTIENIIDNIDYYQIPWIFQIIPWIFMIIQYYPYNNRDTIINNILNHIFPSGITMVI